MFYRRWRRASGIDKIFWWNKHQQANTSFRQAVATAKRLSWQAFCKSLESDFTKATAKVKQLKRRHQSSASFTHPDGPSKASITFNSPPPISSHSTPLSLGSLGPSPSGLSPNGTTLHGTSSSGSLPSGSTPSPSSPPGSTPFNTSSNTPPFTPLTIYTYISQLPTRKAPGTDHIKAEMLKPISTELSHLLSWFFSLCSQWSYVPSLWRHAQSCPMAHFGVA
ncbi:hypothetical protein G6F56_012852 [Rhizopus delemar]|nr:hypothetical protein G6F56_012852 [Rhizopus delemar]